MIDTGSAINELIHRALQSQQWTWTPAGWQKATLPDQFREGGRYADHEIDNENCDACYGSPERCDCGGVIHSEYDDESYNGEDETTILTYCCDKCGSVDVP